jgi:hypothetical protein
MMSLRLIPLPAPLAFAIPQLYYYSKGETEQVKFDIPVVCWSKRRGSITPQEDPVYGLIWAHLGIEQACFKRS